MDMVYGVRRSPIDLKVASGKRSGNQGANHVTPVPIQSVASVAQVPLLYIASMTDDTEPLDSLPRFDARDFEPPAWASGPQFQWGRKDGESSNAASQASGNGAVHVQQEEEEWEDASEGRTDVDPDLATFTTEDLKVTLSPSVDLHLSEYRLC